MIQLTSLKSYSGGRTSRGRPNSLRVKKKKSTLDTVTSYCGLSNVPQQSQHCSPIGEIPHSVRHGVRELTSARQHCRHNTSDKSTASGVSDRHSRGVAGAATSPTPCRRNTPHHRRSLRILRSSEACFCSPSHRRVPGSHGNVQAPYLPSIAQGYRRGSNTAHGPRQPSLPPPSEPSETTIRSFCSFHNKAELSIPNRHRVY